MLLSGTTKSIDMSPTVLVSLERRRCRANVPDSARDSTGAPLICSGFGSGCIEEYEGFSWRGCSGKSGGGGENRGREG